VQFPASPLLPLLPSILASPPPSIPPDEVVPELEELDDSPELEEELAPLLPPLLDVELPLSLLLEPHAT
jgi:hypothetical protein